MSISRPQEEENSQKRKSSQKTSAEEEMRNYILLEKLPGGSARREILQQLQKPKNCNELAKNLGVNWTTIAFHLKKLVKANLVREIKYGKHTYYQTLAKDTKK